MDKIEICKRTRTARENAGFEQKDMPDILGVTLDAYNKYETRSPIRQDLISKFCRITGVREAWLLSGQKPMMDIVYDQESMRLIEEINRLEEQERDLVDAFVSTILQKKEGK